VLIASHWKRHFLAVTLLRLERVGHRLHFIVALMVANRHAAQPAAFGLP
jgi:hypothetical protein